MKIFDLHNDALTCGGNITGGDKIYAIWTTDLSLVAVRRLTDANKNKIMLAIEDCAAFYDNVSEIINCDYKYVGLTWNGYNGFAGGAMTCEHLTDKGCEVIDLLNRRNIAVDTAHLNTDSFFEVADRAKKIICSHTCFYAVNNHPRNLTYEQISAIIGKGGIVGLCFVGEFLGGNTVETVIKHIDWFLDNFGDRNLSIGTDFFGTADLPRGLTSYESFDKLVLAMIRRGWTDSTIHRILYGNAATYFLNNKRKRL